MRDIGLLNKYHITLDLVYFSLYSIEDNYKQFWTAICNLDGDCIQLLTIVYKSRKL